MYSIQLHFPSSTATHLFNLPLLSTFLLPSSSREHHPTGADLC
ncbi:hypothetical protein A2U01_0081902, partial [Trifolium medium]|nr:hypothetical protein [Trifolium medium]